MFVPIINSDIRNFFKTDVFDTIHFDMSLDFAILDILSFISFTSE
jgi:hypothetical protein